MINRLKNLIPQRSFIRLAWHYAKAFVAALVNRFPAKDLTIIGITGTDGKTTTVSMTAHILQQADIPVGALSTAFLQIKEKIEWNETQKTSPSPFIIQNFLRKLTQEGCTHAVLECSSHGLVQHRLDWTWPKIAAITNTSMEHLDYHGTMEQYRKDKAKLFKLRSNGFYDKVHILNADDESFQILKKIPSEKTISYSSKQREDNDVMYWLSDIETTAYGSHAVLHTKDDPQLRKIELHIPGSFNLENALCALCCARALDIDYDVCYQALKSYKGTPGRMERIDEGQPFSVFVDFTVTPAAYKKTLTTLREMIEPGRRILVLTGSCGDRMREKRPIVGKICSELADIVVVTNEDPYTEDPQKIIDEVWAGIDQNACDAHRIFDRREAMQFLLEQAQPGDAVILCAKGSDTTMWTAEGQVPWNEREIARELLRDI